MARKHILRYNRKEMPADPQGMIPVEDPSLDTTLERQTRWHWQGRRKIQAAGVVLLALALACGQTAPTVAPDPPETSGSPLPAPPSDRFVIGGEYAVPGLAEAYAASGINYAKPMPAYGVWANVEPQPGQYDWAPLDALVLEYQRAGFVGLQVLLSAESPWASTRPPGLGDRGDSFPKPEHLGAYETFVAKVVERYDGDGADDIPGLLYPVHDYGIEREFTGYWPSGDAEDYVKLLRTAYPAIKEADDQAQVLLVALLMADVFDGVPEPQEVARRLDQPSLLGYSAGAMRTILAACDSYDAVDFHSLADYSEIPSTAAWIRQELSENGCGPMPIWIGDAFSISALVGYGLGPVPPRPFAPASEATRDDVLALLSAVADPAAEGHTTAVEWLQAEMARGLVKKTVVAAGEGLAGINIGNLEDWSMAGLPPANTVLVRSIGTSAFMGMMDTAVTQRFAGGPLQGGSRPLSRIRRPGAPRPAFFALQLVVQMIGSWEAVDRLDPGVEGVWAYRFDTPAGLVWILWYDDGLLHLPDDPPPTVDLELKIGGESARVTRTPLLPEPARPSPLLVANGVALLTLDATPQFVKRTDQPTP